MRVKEEASNLMTFTSYDAAKRAAAKASTAHRPSTHPFDLLARVIGQMKAEVVPPLIIQHAYTNDGPAYTINVAGTVAHQKERAIHDIAVHRYGLPTARILRLLQSKPHLEQQTIADVAIIPAREARERLYKLFRDGWANYLEITKRPDFNPSSTTFFWYVDTPAVEGKVIEHTYKALYNLQGYRDMRYKQGKHLLEFVVTDPAEVRKYDRFVSDMNNLDDGLLKLDTTLMLLESYQSCTYI